MGKSLTKVGTVKVSTLKKKADAIFSRYIRQRDRNVMGEGVCYTCGRVSDWKKMQCGHFVPRQYLATRYDEINCHAQCYACNMLYGGQPSSYASRLERDFGPGTVERLEGLRRVIMRDFDYQRVCSEFKSRCLQLGYQT